MESSTEQLDDLMDEADTLTYKIGKITANNTHLSKKKQQKISKNFDDLLGDVRKIFEDPTDQELLITAQEAQALFKEEKYKVL